jgi:glycosyltransferase involved in cell wall biosynthesis
MKILQISSVPVTYPGGTEKVILGLSQELSKNNEVTILQTNLYERNKKFERYSKIGKIRVITCKNNFFAGGFGYSIDFIKTLKEIWKGFDIVHIHGHGRFTSDFALRYLKDKRPLIYTAHGFFHTKKAGKIKQIYNFLFRKMDKNKIFFTALTELEKRKYLELNVKKENIKIIPNWIDFKRFANAKRKKIEFKHKFPILLYVGRVHESKGLQYVIRAIKDLQINLLIVGKDGGYKKEIENLINNFGLENRIKLTGEISLPELKNYYKSSNFFVLFSEWEGFGISLIEAMYFKLPAIVSDRGALPILVKNRENGLIAKFPDERELRDKIKLLLSDKKLVSKIKRNEQKFVKKFESKKIFSEYKNLYHEAIK